MKRITQLGGLGLGLTLALTACGGLGAGPTATPQPTAFIPTVTAAAPAATEAGPTETPAPSLLPRPVYFIAAVDGQIWRLEVDGATLTPITHEAEAVTEFDVSPVDQALAYLSANTLIRADADGGQRTVLVTGPTLTGQETEGVTNTLHNPLWSPDGQQVVYGLNGVSRVPAAGGDAQVLQESDPVPDGRAEARFYRPYAWSPDGNRLLMQVNFWQEGVVYAVKNLADSAAQPLEISAVCCEPVWSNDGQSLYFYSYDVSGLNPPGLWRVNASTGEVVVLVDGGTVGETLYPVQYPAEAADGTLYFLMATLVPDANFSYPQPAQYQMFMLPAGAEAGTPPTAVQTDYVAVSYGGATWWLEGPVGVVVGEQPLGNDWAAGLPLVWVLAEGVLTPLPAVGLWPQW